MARMSALRALWAFLTALGLLALGLTHIGWFAPIGDALAVLRPHVIVLSLPVILGLFLLRLWRLAIVTGLCVVVSAFLGWRDWAGVASDTADGLVIYQKNLLWNGQDRENLALDIRESEADIVTLQEVSRQNQIVLEMLATDFPFKVACQSAGNGGIAILSRWPLGEAPGGCQAGEGMILAEVRPPDGSRFYVASVHLNWPFPYDQARQVERAIETLAQLEGPVVIGGDFNMVPWGSSVQRIAKAAGAERLGGYYSTYPGFGILAPLPIDHVLVPQDGTGRISLRPRFGSDHHGLLAHVVLPNSDTG